MAVLEPNVDSEYCERYNGLCGVIEADRLVREDGRLDRFLGEAAPLFIDAKVAHALGISLLHKHNLLTPGLVMYQEDTIHDGERALVCRPVDANSTPSRRIPYMFQLGGSTQPLLHELEYSSDDEVYEYHQLLKSKPDFITQVHDLLTVHDLSRHLGLCILPRQFFANVPSDMVPVEESDIVNTANIVRLRKRSDVDFTKTLQTAWAFQDAHASQCVPVCSRYCALYSPGHAIEHYPNHGMIA